MPIAVCPLRMDRLNGQVDSVFEWSPTTLDWRGHRVAVTRSRQRSREVLFQDCANWSALSWVCRAGAAPYCQLRSLTNVWSVRSSFELVMRPSMSTGVEHGSALLLPIGHRKRSQEHLSRQVDTMSAWR